MVSTFSATPGSSAQMGQDRLTASQVAEQAITLHQALHNPGELTGLLRIMDSGHPQTVLEIGTYAGGSAWAWACIRSVRHIVTVDTEPRPDSVSRLASLACRVTQVKGDSRHPTTLANVGTALEGYQPDVVIIDGGHEYATARHDWQTYAPLVANGGLVMLHDTQGYPGNDTVQVPQLWAEIKTRHLTTELVDIVGGPGGTGIVWM